MRALVLIMLTIYSALPITVALAEDNGCSSGQGVRISGSTLLAVHDAYNPFAGSDLTETKSLTVSNLSENECLVALAFVRAPAAGELANGTQTISYALEAPGSGISLFTSIGPIANPVDLSSGKVQTFRISPGQSVSISVRIRVAGGQIAGPGQYTDDLAEVRVYAVTETGSGTLLDARALTTTVAVNAICVLPTPDRSVIDFTPDIGARGIPTEVWRSVAFPGARCNAPARLSLTGDAMRHESQPGSPPGLDAFINYWAEASFGAALTTLVTDADEGEESATSGSQASDGSLTDDLILRVRLIAGQPLVAGNYSAMLTVSVDPTP